jgi:3-phosphoshikimate 1-carboxyvinyltransferase
MIDEYPVLAMAAACAVGQTAMYGLAELRVKESDRIGATIAGLRACGVPAGAVGDTLLVDGCDGSPPGGAGIACHDDHRIAMSFLTLGLASREPITVDGADMIATSFPGFADLLRSIGARISGD